MSHATWRLHLDVETLPTVGTYLVLFTVVPRVFCMCSTYWTIGLHGFRCRCFATFFTRPRPYWPLALAEYNKLPGTSVRPANATLISESALTLYQLSASSLDRYTRYALEGPLNAPNQHDEFCINEANGPSAKAARRFSATIAACY